jgi:hypothetical protein
VAERKIVSARESFTLDIAGAPIPVGAGDLWYDDDEVVQGREHLFGPVRIRESRPTARRQPVEEEETADRAPGTRRATARRPASADVSTPRAGVTPAGSPAARDAKGVDTSEAVTPIPDGAKPDAVAPTPAGPGVAKGGRTP